MFLQEPVLHVASAALRCLVLFAELRKPDPNREASKKALEHKKEITKHLGRSFIQTNPYEDYVNLGSRGLWVDEKFKFLCDNGDGGHEIKIAMRYLGGLQALYELVILPLRKPELFSYEKLLGPQKGVLHWKTMLAKAIIREFGAVFINMRISNLMSKWSGDAQKLDLYEQQDYFECSIRFKKQGTVACLSDGSYSNE
ncbi:hypothetical protein NC651_027977 [Populus alba x Populus x berolinensis]|nr:hypothetical protein NC651_027977 [Populus alba x Populus x berolinensis]